MVRVAVAYTQQELISMKGALDGSGVAYTIAPGMDPTRGLDPHYFPAYVFEEDVRAACDVLVSEELFYLVSPD